MNKSIKILAFKSFLNRKIKGLKKKINKYSFSAEFTHLIQKKYLRVKSKSKNVLLIISDKTFNYYEKIKPLYFKFSDIYTTKINDKVFKPLRKKVLLIFSKKNAAYEGLL